MAYALLVRGKDDKEKAKFDRDLAAAPSSGSADGIDTLEDLRARMMGQ